MWHTFVRIHSYSHDLRVHYSVMHCRPSNFYIYKSYGIVFVFKVVFGFRRCVPPFLSERLERLRGEMMGYRWWFVLGPGGGLVRPHSKIQAKPSCSWQGPRGSIRIQKARTKAIRFGAIRFHPYAFWRGPSRSLAGHFFEWPESVGGPLAKCMLGRRALPQWNIRGAFVRRGHA